MRVASMEEAKVKRSLDVFLNGRIIGSPLKTQTSLYKERL